MEDRASLLLRDLDRAPETERVAAAALLRSWLRDRGFHDEGAPPGLQSAAWPRVSALLLCAICLVAAYTRGGARRNDECHAVPQPAWEGGAALGAGRAAHADADALTSPPREYPAHSAFVRPLDALRQLRPERKMSQFPLLICAGHGKTATKSLHNALIKLGYRTAHFYGAGVYGLLFGNAAG